MTVGELIEHLQKMPSGLIVVMSKDGEGNGYSPLSDVEKAWYEAETSHSGEVHGDDEEDEIGPNEVRCAVMYPIN